jgi:protein-tyrosine kinase
MTHLEVIEGPDIGKRFVLSDSAILGRSADNAIALADQSTSRTHARFQQRDTGFLIEDLDSKNGTLLRGKRLPPNTSHALKDGDEIRIGNTRLIFYEPTPAYTVTLEAMPQLSLQTQHILLDNSLVKVQPQPVPQQPVPEHVVALRHPYTLNAEQYRKLYVALTQARQTRELRTLLITSSLAAEGKTLSAVNLAITSVMNDDKHGVLLVDTDLRKPSLHKYLGVYPGFPNTPPPSGLANYLLGEVDYSQILMPTQLPGLTVVYAGRSVLNPIPLFNSKRMEHFFQAMKAQTYYTSIILDTCPILLASEPKMLQQHVDTTLLVVHARKTPRKVLSQAIDALGEENILGCIFNGVQPADFSHYRYYYESYKSSLK